MNKSLLGFALAALGGAVGAQISFVPPVTDTVYLSPSITFFLDGRPPQVTGSPGVFGWTSLELPGGCGTWVDSFRVTGDSLVFHVRLPGTLDSGAAYTCVGQVFNTQFNKAGVYQAYAAVTDPKIPCGNCVSQKPLGEFRILPNLVVIPDPPVTGSPVSVKLELGETWSACPPLYSTSSVIKGNNIYLTYQELMVDQICIMMAVYSHYGPTFDLGVLAKGAYNLFIEDSVAVGAFTVSDPTILSGSAQVMQSPFILAPVQPVPGAVISATEYIACGPWYIMGAPVGIPATFTDTTDYAGRFSIQVPNSGLAYDVSAQKAGFHFQQIPWEAAPHQFEMIPSVVDPSTDLEVVVTRGQAPLESVYVELTPGRQMLYCAFLAKAAATPPALSGYTGKDGKRSVFGIQLAPYIDYHYFAYNPRNTVQSKSGMIRLNKYINNVLTIDLGTTGVERSMGGAAMPLSVAPNPFNASTAIRFVLPAGLTAAPEIKIYDLRGQLIDDLSPAQAGGVHQIQWNAAGRPSGVYLLKVKAGNKTYLQKLLLRK